MKAVPTKDELLDEIILWLADEYEAGNPHGRYIKEAEDSPEEFEPLRELRAEMTSERWLGPAASVSDLLSDARRIPPLQATDSGFECAGKTLIPSGVSDFALSSMPRVSNTIGAFFDCQHKDAVYAPPTRWVKIKNRSYS
jgi:hypothetical protein